MNDNQETMETRLRCVVLTFQSDGQEKPTKILISWQELKNQFLSFFCS